MKPVTIIGGGVGGLGLGCALRRMGVPVTIHEAGDYPRHKVCGEFLAGCTPRLLRELGIEPALHGARSNTECLWFHRERPVLRAALPSPAPSLSRHRLDAALALRFQELGGDLRTGRRFPLKTGPSDGHVSCSGRRPVSSSPWVGVKVHLIGFPLVADLEMHLGAGGYTGLCGIENGRVNLCGLFHRASLPRQSFSRSEYFPNLLRAIRLDALADRVEACQSDPDSFRTVAGLCYRSAESPSHDSPLCLGDASGLIAPFTGNGMTLAMESAARAAPLLAEWSASRHADWAPYCRLIARGERRGTAARQKCAQIIQSWLISCPGRIALASTAQLRILPFRILYRMLH